MFQVIRSKLVGPDFVWLLPGWYPPNWWNVSNAECNAEEMKISLEHSLLYNLNHIITNNLSRVIISGKVFIIIFLSLCCHLSFPNRMYHSFKMTYCILRTHQEESELILYLVLDMCMMQCGPLLLP